MWKHHRCGSYNDFRERDAKLLDLQNRMNRARVQGNKHLARELEKAMQKVR